MKTKKKTKKVRLSGDYLRDRIVVHMLFSLSKKERKKFIASLKKKQKKELLVILERAKSS